MKYPNFSQERALKQQGYTRIAGVDEAGCGALAGPVVAGAVILQDTWPVGLNDSKKMTPKRRDALYEEIVLQSYAWHAGIATVEEIENIGIRPATYLAMRRALAGLEGVDYALVDAWTIPDTSIPQHGIIKGDGKVLSIAAASIIAKVTRDRMMQEAAQTYPEYGFDGHKGYGTKKHREAVQSFGRCPMHRANFSF